MVGVLLYSGFMARISDNTIGALFMAGSMACFTFGDSYMKLLGGAVPLAQVLVLRGLIATVFIYLLARYLGQLQLNQSRRDWATIAIRCAAELGATYFFLTALNHLPLANISALMQSLPLTVTLGAALFFGEAVGWRRWLAIAVGFVGMLLIVRPGGDGFTVFSIYALIAVAFVTLRDLITRRLSPAVPSLTVTLCAAVCVTLFSGFWSTTVEWVPMDKTALVYLLGASFFIIGGYCFSVMTMRIGAVSVSAPFRYTSLLWALVLGWYVFNDWPDALTLIGAALIVAMGLFTLWREGRLRQENTDRI